MVCLVIFSLTWQIFTVDAPGNVGQFSSIAMRGSEIHIAYYDATFTFIKYAFSPDLGNSWSFDTVYVFTGGNTLKWLSLALDSSGVPHIVFSDNSNDDISHAYFNGTTWTIEVVDNNGDLGSSCSIFIDDSNHIHIAYSENTWNDLKYAINRNGTWQIGFVDQNLGNREPRGIDIAVDKNYKVHISYWDRLPTNNRLKYATGNFGAWTIYNVEASGTNTGGQSSIFFDSTGNPHISYFRYGGNRGLKYAFFNGTNFDTFYLDAFNASLTPAQGQWSSIKLSSLDSIWIAYYDDNISGLKVLKKSALKWDTLIVDSLGDVGRFSSLDLTSEGDPVISYYDAPNQDLKLAIGIRPDFSPPGPPEDLKANGKNPSPWTNTGVFELTWITPYDKSGIKRGLYKLFAPPTSNSDTTGSLKPYSPDTVFIGQQGIVDLYMWLEDGAGNANYNNNSLVKLRYDAVSPQGSDVNIPSKYSNNTPFNVTWSKGIDFGIIPSGIKSFNVYYKDGNNPWNTFLSDYPDTFALFNGVDGHIYYFESVAIDSAGNTENRTFTFEDTIKVDLTPPSAPSNLSVSPSVWTYDSLFIFTWNEPLDFTGIKNRFYKLFMPPSNENDYTGTLHKSPDTIKILNEGKIPIYIWLSDSAGNSGWQNSASINIKRDTSKPFNSKVSILPLSINQDTLKVVWTKGNDNVSGILSYELYYKLKGGNWNLYQANIFDTFIIFNFQVPDTMYYFEVAARDSAGNREIITGIPEDSIFIDISAPPPPQNLLANGANPSPWNSDSLFVLTWINPPEPSGISRALYKIGAKPSSNYDTTGSLKPVSPDTVYTTVEGGIWLYMWLIDGLGNVNYNNMDSVLLRHDHTPPSIVSINPPNGAQNVPVNTDIIINFSEKLNAQTVSDTNFVIEGKSSGFHNFTLIYDSLNYVVTLSPHTGFASQETVFVRISQNIKDPAGNTLYGQREFHFVTEIIPDTEGPVCFTTINPPSPEPFNYLEINSLVSDTGLGNSKITYAEMFIDSIGSEGTGIPLEPLDGNYDENVENVYKKIDLAIYGFKPGEIHYIFLHAKDLNNNFGKFDTLSFTLSPDDDTLPPSFSSFTEDTFMPNYSFYIKGVIKDPSSVYDDTTGSNGQGAYIIWDTDGELDTSYKELQIDRLRGDTFITIREIQGPGSGEIVYKVYAYDNDFDTEHPLDRKKGESRIFKILFYYPMVVELTPSPEIVYIGDSLNVEIKANIPFNFPPVCSIITSKGSLKEEISVFKESENKYKGKIITVGADIGKARVIAYYYDFGKLKKKEDTVLISAKGEFLPENTVYVWPNPAREEGNFHFYINQNAKVKVEIFDIRGKKITEASGIFKGGVKPHTLNSNAIKLNLKSLAPEIYIFRLKAEALDTKDKKTVIKKFAIVR